MHTAISLQALAGLKMSGAKAIRCVSRHPLCNTIGPPHKSGAGEKRAALRARLSSPTLSYERPFTMKLDVNVLRYLSKDDWRVLTSVEMGEKNVSGGGNKS